jgi:trimethylamine--corrinoid protein Co-methyltransferase
VVANCGAVSVLRHILGSTCQHQNANTLFKQVLAKYTPSPMDSDINDELLNFVNRRKAGGGAPTDF